MKQKVGIGYLKLILCIIAIVVLVIIGAFFAKNEIKKEQVKDFQADLLLVQAKVELVKGNYSMNKEENPLKGIQLSVLPEDINIEEFLNENVILEEDKEKYYLLNREALEACELQSLVDRYDGYFIVNYDTYEVIYTKGYENSNGVWCYKVSDMNKAKETSTNNVIETSAPAEQSTTEEVPAQEETTENNTESN